MLQRVFREGNEVQAGEVLFRIDPAPLQAEVDSAAAALHQAEASAFQARRLAERHAALVESEAISRQAQDDARGASLQAQAEVAAAQAALKRVRLALMTNFFIDRPVFAWVVALLILLAGLLAIPQLPVAQFPMWRRRRSS